MANQILKMGPLAGSIIVSEATMWRSRDETPVVIPAGGAPSGTLLKVAGETLTPITAVEDDAVAVLLFDQFRHDEAEAETRKATVMARDCELRGNGLVFPEGATGPQKITLVAKLANVAGIVVRW